MRVLVHIHTYNEAEFITQVLESLQRQSRPPDSIVIVDNGSTDGTLDRTFAEHVTIVRNPTNIGTTGSVAVGLSHALKEGFDWTWLLDADSVPEPDALENLLAFFDRLPSSEQERVCFLACRLAAESQADHRPIVLTASGIDHGPLGAGSDHYRCDCFIWSGSLFRMAAVAQIGLPAADYFMDQAELEYGYRARQLGYSSYVVFSSLLHHDVGRSPGVTTTIWRFGPLSFRLHEMSPLRCYYYIRNTLYFWLYQCRPIRSGWCLRRVVHAILFLRNFAIRPMTHHRHLLACLRGLWDGTTGHLERRY